MPFLPKTFSAAVNTSSSSGGYLSLSKLPDGGSVRFALLTNEPLVGYEAWGSSNGTNKPFRFAEEPTYEDIKVEMGEFEPREGRGGPGTADVKPFIAMPVYSYEAGKVQILQITQKTVMNELDKISQEEDYSDLTEWDFSISKKGTGLKTEYTVLPLPRKKGSQEHVDAAWLEAKAEGFALERLMTGENPFKAG